MAMARNEPLSSADPAAAMNDHQRGVGAIGPRDVEIEMHLPVALFTLPGEDKIEMFADRFRQGKGLALLRKPGATEQEQEQRYEGEQGEERFHHRMGFSMIAQPRLLTRRSQLTNQLLVLR